MKTSWKIASTLSVALAVGSATLSTSSWAKLPPPSDDAKAKAAEAAAKTAHAGQVDNYKLCLSMDKVAAHYVAAKKKAGAEVKPATATAPCADPGPFVYPPPAPGAAPAVAAAPAAAPAPAAAAAAAKKAVAAAPAPKK